jgi:2,4-dienoyl-CoA reductase-like NADH-dependent reductase (Old Yellow Enzyme family)
MSSSAPAGHAGPNLFTPFTMRGLTLPNRLVVSPMCQYSADEGRTTDWHVVHLGQMAMSGAGLLLIEATAVEPIGRITPGCVGLWDDATEAALARTLAAIRPLSTMPIGIQIGIVPDTLPHASFQILRQPDRQVLVLSPFRLGEQPNVRIGVAMITSAPEALALHQKAAEEMWSRALKGAAAAKFLRGLIAKYR